jgi:hypothetical protein
MPAPGSLIDDVLPRHDARTVQQRAVVLEHDSPWILVGEHPGAEVVLGLLWTPRAGGTTCAPEEFAAFARGAMMAAIARHAERAER